MYNILISFIKLWQPVVAAKVDPGGPILLAQMYPPRPTLAAKTNLGGLVLFTRDQFWLLKSVRVDTVLDAKIGSAD